MRALYGSLALIWTLGIAALAAAESASDRIVVPFSDPTRPGTVRVSLMNGGITVTGYPGKEVLVRQSVDVGDEDEADAETPRPDGKLKPPKALRGLEPPAPPDAPDRDADVDERARGLRRIANASADLSIEESQNVVEIGTESFSHTFDLDIQVPAGTSLELRTVNDGDIVVRNVDGEIDVENTNGEVVLREVSGSVVAHALNGDLVVTLQRVDPKKEMSFSSMNGNIDVTLPPGVRADVRIKSDNGEIYTDFDLQLGTRSEARGDDRTDRLEARSKTGKRRHYGYESAMYGTLNGGGPTLRFQTFNGNVYIRKAK